MADTQNADQLREEAQDLKLSIRGLEQAAESAKIELANTRNQLAYSGDRATERDLEAVRTAEAKLASAEERVDLARAELARVNGELAALKAAEDLARARAARAAKVAELSESHTPAAALALVARQGDLATARAEHETLQRRTAELKRKAATHDRELAENAREHARALARGAEPPPLMARIDYAAVLKECGAELERSKARIASAERELANAERELAKAEASDAYAALYAAIEPALATLPALPIHPEAWDQVFQVSSRADLVQLTFYRPRA